jgi:hypothetical protein
MQYVFGVLLEDWKKALIVIIFFLQLGNISFDYARMRVGIAKGEREERFQQHLRCGYGTTYKRKKPGVNLSLFIWLCGFMLYAYPGVQNESSNSRSGEDGSIIMLPDLSCP